MVNGDNSMSSAENEDDVSDVENDACKLPVFNFSQVLFATIICHFSFLSKTIVVLQKMLCYMT